MTTENHPADPSAATEVTDPPSSCEASPPRASADDPPDATSPPQAIPEPVTAPVPDTSTAEPPAATAPTGQVTDVPQTPDSPAAVNVPGQEASESPAPVRRVRLNPTVAPEVARAIPNLRPSDPPTAPVSPPADVIPAASVPPVDVADVTEATAAAVSDDSASAAEPPPAPTPPPAAPVKRVEIPRKGESLDQDLEAALDAALSGEQQAPAEVVAPGLAEAQAIATSSAITPDVEVKRGDRLTGTVASIHGDDMFLDFGLRLPGVLSRRQFGLRKQPMQGETLDVVVNRIDEKEGLINVNLPTGTSKVRGEWDALSVDQNVECLVTATNKGGLEVSIGVLRGFMPASQVELGFVPDLAVYIGQKLTARISEVNPKRRKLVLSRRALLEEEREQAQQGLFETIEVGQQFTGRVRSLKDYGAFVDIGGVDGLLHVAQISWSRITHPSEVLTEGEQVQVQVLSIDKEKKKVSLGMRQLTQNPWKSAETKFAQGAHLKGKVTRIENFGAFIELEDGVEGLVHISELDHKRVNKVTEVLRVGQEVDVQVLEVDTKRKRVSLSVKALKEKPEDPQEKAEAAPIKRQRDVDSLVGGIGQPTGGQLFGDPSKFGR